MMQKREEKKGVVEGDPDSGYELTIATTTVVRWFGGKGERRLMA